MEYKQLVEFVAATQLLANYAWEREPGLLWEKRPMIYRTLSRKLSCLPRVTCEYWRGCLVWNN